MDELLHVHGSLLNPPVPLLKEHDVVGKDDDDMDEECVHEITPELLHECVSEQNETEFLNSISKLTVVLAYVYHHHMYCMSVRMCGVIYITVLYARLIIPLFYYEPVTELLR